MIHKTKIEGYDLQTLANEIGDLRYDALQEFLLCLALKLKKDSLKDRMRGRTQLANQLDEASNHIEKSVDSIEKAWIICEPFT
jgi:hypothetical protein